MRADDVRKRAFDVPTSMVALSLDASQIFWAGFASDMFAGMSCDAARRSVSRSVSIARAVRMKCQVGGVQDEAVGKAERERLATVPGRRGAGGERLWCAAGLSVG